MIYRFTIISDESDDFVREIKIDSDATFLELHKLILESCGYKDDQMTSFTICEHNWEKGVEITLEEMDTDSDVDSYVMADTRISDLIEEEKQRLIYTFDPLADRCFFIELTEIITGKSLKNGEISLKRGDAPAQTLDFDELMAKNPTPSTGLDDEDLYGNEIDDEDISLEGLDISDGNPYE